MATPHPKDNSDIHHGDFEKIACIVFVSITPVFLIARFMARILAKQVGMDDWASLGAWVCDSAGSSRSTADVSRSLQ